MGRACKPAALLMCVLLFSCSPEEGRQTSPAAATPSASVQQTSDSGTSTDQSVAEAGEAPAAVFTGGISEIDPARLEFSWQPGCPVPVQQLRLVSVSHRGFDGRSHQGEMVVHRDHADGIVAVMRQLFESGFPIERMELVDAYGGDDDLSMAANNTSGFNCRRVEGSASWSEHAYGRAIDINPVQNPYVSRSGRVDPPAGAEYLDRSDVRPGMVVDGDAVVEAFASIGWQWGGNWAGARDYQHFSSTGR